MTSRTENDQDARWLDDLPLRSAEIGFAAEQMIVCRKCGKPNPPTRAKCFYCSFELEVPKEFADGMKLNVRRLENWEKGINVILMPDEVENDSAADELSLLLAIEKEIFLQMIHSRKPLPVARVGMAREAELIANAFARHGLECRSVSDACLAHEIPPVRLRAMEFGDGAVILQPFNTGEQIELAAGELTLIVTGEIFTSRMEASEKRTKREMKTSSETQTSSDEKVIDLYSKDSHIGWRVPARGFDFSCLGAAKSLLAGENMNKLGAKLKAFSPTARFVDDYSENLGLLEYVWEIELTKESLGIQRSLFGGVSVGSVSSCNNQTQFTKYSRMQWHLL